VPLQRKELEPVLDFVTLALDEIRKLQAADLEREQFRNKIYHHLYEAQLLILNDSWVPPGREAPRSTGSRKGEPKLPLVERFKQEAALAKDLDLLK
jgi:hypothetical protein